jgi:hypothetical protein
MCRLFVIFETFNDGASVLELAKRRTGTNGDHIPFQSAIIATVSEAGEKDERHQSSWSVVRVQFEPRVS